MARCVRRLSALVFALLLTVQLMSPPARGVLSGVYFTAVNDDLLELDTDTMPFWSGGQLYVSSVVFTGTYASALGVSFSPGINNDLAVLYSIRSTRTALFFDLGSRVTYDNRDTYYTQTALERNDSNIKYLQEHIWEEYTLTYQNALELKEEGYEADKAPANINRIKRAINQLGAVNHHAVEDFEDLNARYNETKEVYNDLEQAKADLEKIISELVNEIDGKFTEAFNKINDNFAVTFKQLFGGGEAKLMLVKSETEDPLDAGVEIYAQPPGKKARLLSQLSGGEQALTSIAILFAILQFKAMPFCLLDEVEAALDDSNAALFAEYLGQLSGGTQFIVITHRKPTMEAADHIFGVTTEERGVSKIISIELSEAQKHAQGDD